MNIYIIDHCKSKFYANCFGMCLIALCCISLCVCCCVYLLCVCFHCFVYYCMLIWSKNQPQGLEATNCSTWTGISWWTQNSFCRAVFRQSMTSKMSALSPVPKGLPFSFRSLVIESNHLQNLGLGPKFTELGSHSTTISTNRWAQIYRPFHLRTSHVRNAWIIPVFCGDFNHGRRRADVHPSGQNLAPKQHIVTRGWTKNRF